MSIDSPEYKNYDVQYSIRLPQDLADEINARAERDGVKPSTWIRNSLAKLIQMKDTENAGNIKAAVMYLLSTDKDVQKQIRLLIGENSEKGSRISKVESTLTEFTALSDQEIILKRKMEELEIDISDLQNKLCLLGDKLREITEKRSHVEAAFGNPDDSKNLHFFLVEFEEKEKQMRRETSQLKQLLDEKRNQMLGYKMFISDLTVRKKQLLTKYNRELSMNRNSGREAGVSEEQEREAEEHRKNIENSRGDSEKNCDVFNDDDEIERRTNNPRESQKTSEEFRRMIAAETRRKREEEQKRLNRKSVEESEDI